MFWTQEIAQAGNYIGHWMKFNDRSLDKARNVTVFPTDYEILEIFWTNWMEKSGVKRFKMKRTLTSEMDAEQEISGFLGVK
ncbi:hypothetical protein [Litoribacter populi]|uniref:hypothetical protein n=1 Tax=Litoribacter populi TaxID=2598460 RepID=UPI00117F8FA4|nr:hypothetical protein [Litoribacter populi]